MYTVLISQEDIGTAWYECILAKWGPLWFGGSDKSCKDNVLELKIMLTRISLSMSYMFYQAYIQNVVEVTILA